MSDIFHAYWYNFLEKQSGNYLSKFKMSIPFDLAIHAHTCMKIHTHTRAQVFPVQTGD